MSKKILVDAVYPGETRVVIYDKNRVQDFDYENSHKKQLKGNIYLARITRVEPSLQAAFIEYGGGKHGFLPFNEVHPSYFLLNQEGNFEQEKTGAPLSNKIPFITLPEVQEVEEEPVAESNAEEEPKEPGEDGGEMLPTEEEVEEEQEQRDTLHQKYKIQDVLKKGQVLLIQIIKEERGNKGAACTSYISLAGRYCVLMPNSDRQGGISRRIVNINDRRRLKSLVSSLDLPEGVSIILRTAGAGKNSNDIRRDYFYLVRLWNTVREHALAANVNSFIHAESDLLKRTIRDLYSSEVTEIQIQGTEAFKAAKDFMKKMLPLHVNKVKEYRSKVPIFTKFNIEEQISALYQPVAHLPSGGYIVINPTEALIAIDVNSGKATTERNIEETATKTNIEAAIEIARQLRLRDMSGLIVIDFIDMVDSNNRRAVERALRDSFQTDRAKVQLGNISAFGLLELSRQRLQSSFMEANTDICPSCAGKGHIKSFDSNSLIMLRTIESEIYKGDAEVANIYAHPDIVMHLLNNKRAELARLEELYKCKIILHKETTVYYDGFALEKVTKNEKSGDRNDIPKFIDEGYIDSDLQETEEDKEISLQEAQFGLGKDLAPYQVNDDSAMSETVEAYNRNNRNKFRKGPMSSGGGRRRINNNPAVEVQEKQVKLPEHKPALIYQAEEGRKKPNHRHRSKKFHGRREKEVDGNKDTAKKSTLKSWWDRLIE
jgi:ribonuclease E